MATIMKHKELVKKALLWADEHMRENPSLSILSVLDEAGARFNLSPKDAEALTELFETSRSLTVERNR